MGIGLNVGGVAEAEGITPPDLVEGEGEPKGEGVEHGGEHTGKRNGMQVVNPPGPW